MRQLSFVLLCVVGLGAAGEPPPVDVTALRSAVAQQRKEYVNCFKDGNTIAPGDCGAATYNRLADNAKIHDRRALAIFLGVFHETIRPSNEPHRALIYAWFHFIDAVMHEEEAYEARSHPAGKRPLYDAAALPDAKMVELTAVRRCETQRAYDFSALYACDLAAARAFVTAIKYRDMYRFDNFALRLQLDADGVNKAGPTAEQMEVRFNLLHDELFAKFGNVFP